MQERTHQHEPAGVENAIVEKSGVKDNIGCEQLKAVIIANCDFAI